MTEVTEAMIAAGLTYDLKTWRRAGDDDAYYSALYRAMEAARIPAAPEGALDEIDVFRIIRKAGKSDAAKAKAVAAALSAIPIPEMGEVEIGTRCKRCGTSAPAAFARECNWPECEYRAALTDHTTKDDE